MNSGDEALLKALRDVAAASPQGAPPELGDRLKGTFVRHHTRRRRRRVAFISAAVVCLFISAAWLGVVNRQATLPPQVPQAAQPSSATTRVVARTVDPDLRPPASSAPTAVRPRWQRRAKGHTKKHVAPPMPVVAADFVALPSFDPAVPTGDTRILRVELPGTALQLIGYPANEQLLERRVVTDLLVGQDGLPYAVRLIQTRSNHQERQP